MEQNNYICEVPIVLIVFNRPSETKIIVDALRIVSPKIVVVLSDGSRINNQEDLVNVSNTRSIIETIDWECEIVKIYRDQNFGCMNNIVLGLNQVFNQFQKAIILEDDCKPNLDFFKFMEWGLVKFEDDKNIGMISGSNLVSDQYNIELRNGFSSLINIWGWATWKDRWFLHNSLISINEINSNCDQILDRYGFNFWQKMYWRELFKFTVYSGKTWDFQLQYSFFKNNLKSVYPRTNLVENIGFSGNGTHTNFSCPDYVKNNIPLDNSKIMFFRENTSGNVFQNRDFLLAKIIWHFNFYSAVKLKIRNYLLAFNLLK